MAADLRIGRVGVIQDIHGKEVEVSVMWDADLAGDSIFEPVVRISGDGDIELDQGGCEAFARLFVSACWEAARVTPGDPDG